MPLLFTWPYNTIYMVAAVITALPERPIRRGSRGTPATQDEGSSRVLTVGGVIGAAGAWLVAFLVPAAAMPAPYLMFWLGIAALVAARLLRHHAFRMLGSSFTLVIHVVPGQQVIERGAYRWIRHPAYTAAGFGFISIGLAAGNWASVGVLLLSWLIVYAYRVTIEERTMVAVLGEPYRAYMERTRRFLPFVF